MGGSFYLECFLNLAISYICGMRYILIFLFLVTASMKAQVIHCGYDFTSYFVLDVHEAGSKEMIKNLKITVVDSTGTELINFNNLYSFRDGNKPMRFMENYRIGDDNRKLAEGATAAKERWFFPFAKQSYLLSVSNTFPADSFSIKIEDIDGKENGGKFKTLIVPLHSYNMYVLCSNESQQAAVKFGRKMNKPIDIVLEKE